MKCSKIRTGLLTFILGIISVPFLTPLLDKWREPYVELPQIESESPIVIKLCSEEASTGFFVEHGYVIVKPEGINCNTGGGGSGGGNGWNDSDIPSVGRYVDEVPEKASLKDCLLKRKKD